MHSSLSTQRDLQARYRQQLFTNIYLLNMRHSFGQELSRMVNEELFEKPNQNLFIHLSHYLVKIIDPKRASMLSWPLLEKKSENLYRTQFVNFCLVYFKDGTVTQILSSHLVNAGGFKIIRLMFQLSELALKSSVQKSIDDSNEQRYQIELLNNSSEISNCQKIIRTKISAMKAFQKKAKYISELYKKNIVQLEQECKCTTELLTNIIDSCPNLNESEKFSLKNVMEKSSVIETWEIQIEKRMDKLFQECRLLEDNLLVSSAKCKELAESIVMRHTLKDSTSFTLEYKPDKDFINTSNVEPHVSAHQKSILKNIVKDNILIFPNLLKAYCVVLGFLFKNIKLTNQMNDNLEILERNVQRFTEIKEGMEEIVTQVQVLHHHVKENADQNMDYSYLEDEELMAEYRFINISPLPRLVFKPASFNDPPLLMTPINLTKIQFNIGRKRQELNKPMSLFPQTVHHKHDRLGIKVSDIKSKLEGIKFLAPKFLPTPKPTSSKRLNHTALDVRPSFSTDQINRLLSSRKSSFKKQSHNNISVNHQGIKASLLFNETIQSGSPLYKCYSSPNLIELNDRSQFVRQRHIFGNTACQTVAEDGFSANFNVSGQHISIEVNSPLEESAIRLNSSQSLLSVYTKDEKMKENTPNISPKIVISSEDNTEIDREKDDILSNIADTPKYEQKNETKVRTSSIERILKRYKKVRESTLKPINYDIFTENDQNIANTAKVSPLPDLLSSGNKFNNDTNKKHPRESLGQALGVNATILDDFDLIDI